MEIKGILASVAIALASKVLPHPGGPISKIPFTSFPPIFFTLELSFIISTTSIASFLAFSKPITSVNLTFTLLEFTLFFFNFENPPLKKNIYAPTNTIA